MVNFKFVKSQLKNIIVLLIVFFVILFILFVPALTQNYLTTTIIFTKDGSSESSSQVLGAIPILSNVYFGPPGFIFMFIISLVLSHFLVSKEVDKGYFASWLTTPMSRKTILNSKLLILLTSIFSIYFLILIVQLISFPLRFQDFEVKDIGNIILANFVFIVLALLWASINWICITGFNKTSIALALSISISVLFIVFQALTLFASIPSLEYLKYFKYFTITSLFNSPFELSSIKSPLVTGDGTFISHAEILPIKALDFVWQIPLMLGATAGLFYLGNYLFIKKDLSL